MLSQKQRLTIARLEVPHRRWYRRAMAVFDRRWLREFFPYAVYAAGFWLFALPYIAVVSGVVASVLWVAAPGLASTLVVQGEAAMENPLVAAGVLAVAYTPSLLLYRPINKNDYGPDGNSTPTDYEEFESMMTVMALGALPFGYFLLLRFEGEVGQYLNMAHLSPFTGALVGLVCANLLLYKWLDHRYGRDRTVKPQMAALYGTWMLVLSPLFLYLAQIPLGLDIILYGSPGEPTEAVFAVSLWMLAFTMRRLRWTVNEDLYGFRGIDPIVPVWGVPRVVFVFGLAAVWQGAPLTELVIGACFAPLVGGLVYLGWRIYTSGDGKAPAYGWLSSPGRKTYEKHRKENERKLAGITQAKQRVQEFNEFAADHGLETLPEPSMVDYNPQDLKETLDEIDRAEARELTGDDFTEYARLRDAVRDEVER